MTQTDNVSGGIATLAADATAEFDSSAPWKVNGVALPVNTVVNGGQNVDHYFPEEVLQRAAELLEGVQIVKNFHEIDGQASADQVIGKITSAAYQKGIGIVFEGEVADKDIAQKVAQGYLDVSPTVARSLGEFDESMGAQRVNQITGFRDLAVVANGQPGAKIEIGGNSAVTALGMDALSRGFQFDVLQSDMTPPEQAQTNAQAVLDIRDKTDAMTDTGWRRANQLADGEELSADVVQKMAQFNRHQDNTEYDNFSDIPESKKSEDAENPWWEDNGTVAWLGWGGTAGVEWAIEKSDEMDNMGDTLESDFKTVAGVRFRGTRDGELDESEIPNDDFEDHYLYPGDTKSESSYPVVDGDGYLRKGNVDSAWSLGARGGVDDDEHDRKLMELAAEFDSPPEWADSMETTGAESLADTQSDDGENENTPQSSAANSSNTMSENDLSDEEKAVLAAADDIQDAADVLNAYGAAEQPEIVEQDVLSTKDEQIDELTSVFREVLAAKKDLSEEIVSDLSVDALTSEFRNEEGEIETTTLSQIPETGDVKDEPDTEPENETLSAEDKEEIESLLQRADLLKSRTPEHADTLRSKAADLAGVEDADDIEVDAL